MQEMLVINPAKRARRKSRKAASPAQRRARAAFAAASRARSKNPAKRRARRHNPAGAVARRRAGPARRIMRRGARRRNPISMGGFGSTAIAMVKDAAIGGAGAIAADYAMWTAAPYLPDALRTGYGGVATKALGTVALGMLSRKFLGGVGLVAARGALSVQAYSLMKSQLPASTFKTSLGYMTPTSIMPGGYSGKPIAMTRGNARLNGLGLQTTHANAATFISGMGSMNNTRQGQIRSR